MNHLKWSLVKRIFIFMLCTMFLSSIVFFSYENTMIVMAIDESDLVYDAVIASLAAIGVYVSGGTLGTLALAVAPVLAASGKDIYDYVIENEDGTTTISEDFVNLVLQAYKEYVKQNFDGKLNYDEDTMYYDYGETVWKLYQPGEPTVTSVISSFKYAYPFAILFKNGIPYGSSGSMKEYNCEFYFYNGNPESANGGIALANNYLGLVLDPKPDPYVIHYKNGQVYSKSNNFSVYGLFGSIEGIYATISSSTVPIYTNYDQMVTDFHSNKFEHAENYCSTESSGQTSSYTGEYIGGNITVDTEKLNGISDKLAEFEESNNSIEEILKAILEWLELNGGGNGSGGGGNVTVNIDLSTTNRWLSKIYEKVCQIYDRMSETVENAEQAALDGIKNSLDEITEILKKIKGWTIADTIIDGVDAVADWADFVKDLLTDVTSGVSDVSSSMTDAANLMKTKFPFCLPWDVAMLVTFLAHEPQTPVFQLPIIFENFGIEEYIVIDMTQFSAISTLSRTILTLIYCYGLINLTFKVIPMVKEES